jgi:hypothetical protein
MLLASALVRDTIETGRLVGETLDPPYGCTLT